MLDYWRVNNAEMGIELDTMSKMRFWFWRTGSLIVRNGESQHFLGFEYGFFLFRNGTINSHWGILIPNLMMTDDNRMIASTNQIQPSVLVDFCNQLWIYLDLCNQRYCLQKFPSEVIPLRSPPIVNSNEWGFDYHYHCMSAGFVPEEGVGPEDIGFLVRFFWCEKTSKHMFIFISWFHYVSLCLN